MKTRKTGETGKTRKTSEALAVTSVEMALEEARWEMAAAREWLLAGQVPGAIVCAQAARQWLDLAETLGRSAR